MMNFLNTLNYTNERITYDGLQLQPHWIYKKFDLLGDALVAFAGAAEVPIDHMVDLTDVKRRAPIYSPLMLHFLGEWFIDSLLEGVLRQHLFVATLFEVLSVRQIRDLRRHGNDLFIEDRKLSVSIATASGVSVLMHTALNIETHGTPVPTAGLSEINIEPAAFANEVLARFRDEWSMWDRARVKVRAR